MARARPRHIAGRKRAIWSCVGRDMEQAKRSLSELVSDLQKEADKIGAVDPKFDQKVFFDALHKSETDALSR